MLKGIDFLDTAVIDEDLIGGALVEEADGDQHISSMTTFELAQVRILVVVGCGKFRKKHNDNQPSTQSRSEKVNYK